MHQIQLSNQAYENLARRSAAYGFASVEAYLNEEGLKPVVTLDAETRKKLERSIAEAKAGRLVSFDTYQAEVQEHRSRWLRRNARKV